MPIIDAEKGALRPLVVWVLLGLWLHNVENNCYTVLVIIAHNALVGVGTISSNYAITLSAVFGRLIVWHKRFDEFISARTDFVSKILKEVFAWYIRITLQHHWFLDFGIGRCGALASSKQRTCIEHFFCVEKWRCALSRRCITGKPWFNVTWPSVLLLGLLRLIAHIHATRVTLV